MARKNVASNTQSAQSVLKRKRWLVLAGSGVAVVGICVLVRLVMGSSSANAQIPNPFHKSQPQQETGSEPSKTASDNGGQASHNEQNPRQVMAIVNGQEIRRDALGTACVERFGKDVLEGMTNKRLIMHYCKNRNIEVTDAEVDAEIDHMAKRFKISREQLLDMLHRERGVNVVEYKRDILWPELALRKCAADQLNVTDEQLKEAYESKYGPAVQCRLIVVKDRQLAEKIHREVTAHPNDFARLAMQDSVDVNSASIGGLIQPVRHHLGDPAIEREVFELKPKQISQIIPVGEQFAILKCEALLPARNVPLESVREELTEQIKESRLRTVAGALFKDLQKSATVQNVWNNPQLHSQMPGVVEIINGEQITYSELAEECLLRYGRQVLEVEISHLLLHQALANAKLTVTEQDLNDEMAHAAQLAGVVDKNGKPDMAKWIQTATKDQGVTKDEYIRDSVWPSAALKKLTGASVQVTKEDLQKGFEANYGERVRCRAIVLSNMRQAQDVWNKARQNTSPDYFGDLAEKYSVEATSKSLRGEVPPIRRFGGQPQLEDVAFSLKPGELSGIIQIGNQFVILKSEGRTAPVEVNPQEVHDVLYQDIYEKKLRIAMSQKFDAIRTAARIDNFLAGTSQTPEQPKSASPNGVPRVDEAVRQTSGQSR
ncbi:MAG TPA: peptidylprolyl isomerase [Lacipirellulaceae bacterium]|nr:peptidylprolyl isomerase [Lacipirellulaceae bacterium]